MANYSNLKTAIENAVDWNNGDNEITGQNLLDILETIIDSLGAKYKFADVATPSSSITTPDEPLFYLAGAGTYTNFGGLSVTIPRGTLAIFYYDTAWHYTTVRTDSDAFFNVNQYLGTPSTTYTKANARNAVPAALRSKGMIITYLTTNGWLIEQNLSTSGTWNADANWQTIGPVSVSQNTSTGGLDINIGSEIKAHNVITPSKEGAKALSEGDDLNDLTYGVYSFLSSVTPTLVNCPLKSGGGMIIVERPTPAQGNYRKQTIMFGVGPIFTRSERNINDWTDWESPFTPNMSSAIPLSANTDLNSLTYGVYSFTGTESPTLVNAPRDSGGGMLIVERITPSSSVSSKQTIYYGLGYEYQRFNVSGSFTQWVEKSAKGLCEREYAIPLAANTDLNSLSYGVYSFASDISPTLVNSPINSGGGMIIVEKPTPTTGNYRRQTIVKGTGETFVRSERGIDTWNDWGEIAPLNKGFLEQTNNESNLLPSYWVDEINDRINTVLTNRLTIGNNIAEFIFITDTHYLGNAKNSPLLIRYLQKALSIKRVVFGGDAIEAAGSTKLAGLQELQKFVGSFDELFFTVGNHDYNNAYSESVKLTDAQLYPAIGKQTEQYAVTNKSIKVSYFDNVNQKVRFIQYAYTLTNVQDVLDCISGLGSDWTVVFFTHMYWEPHTDGVPTVIAEKKAFMNSIIAGTYQCTIAVFIVGHVHKDVSDTLDNDIPVIGTTTDCYRSWINKYGGPTMTRYTNTEQAFDIIQLDTANKKLYYTRVGAGQDREFSY